MFAATFVKKAYDDYVASVMSGGQKLPENKESLQHYLDCVVVDHLYEIMKKEKQPFDTVKGVFIEGSPIYLTSRFYQKTHIQVCVRNTNCIKGVFRV